MDILRMHITLPIYAKPQQRHWQLQQVTQQLWHNAWCHVDHIAFDNVSYLQKQQHTPLQQHCAQYGHTYGCGTPWPLCICHALGEWNIDNKEQYEGSRDICQSTCPGQGVTCVKNSPNLGSAIKSFPYASSARISHVKSHTCLTACARSVCSFQHSALSAQQQPQRDFGNMPSSPLADKNSNRSAASADIDQSQAPTQGVTRDAPDMYNPASYVKLEEAPMILAIKDDSRVDIIAVYIELAGRRYVFNISHTTEPPSLSSITFATIIVLHIMTPKAP